MSFFLRLAVLLFVRADGRPACNTFTDCEGCAGTKTWIPSAHCRWCPTDLQCHSPASPVNPCSTSQTIHEPDKCGKQPEPAPGPPLPAPSRTSKFVTFILEALFKLLNVNDVDAKACVTDTGGVEVALKDFVQDVASLRFETAVVDLGRGLTGLSQAVVSCKLPEVQNKIDILATSIRWANISTSGLDKTVKILVGASDLWRDIEAVYHGAKDKDADKIASTLKQLMDDWSSVVGGCSNHFWEKEQTACKFVDGILRVVQTVASEVKPCEDVLKPAFNEFVAGADAFVAKNYSDAISQFSTGVKKLGEAVISDPCGLKIVASAVSDVSPALANAVVKVEKSGAVKIIVGIADVYEELYAAAVDLKKGDFAGAGVQMGLLLAKLRASKCKTKACIVTEGLLSSLQVGVTDLTACRDNIDAVWEDLQHFLTALETQHWHDAISEAGTVFQKLSESMKSCGIDDVASGLEKTATALGDEGLALKIAGAVQILVKGSDISRDVAKIVEDRNAQRWTALGEDLGRISDWVSGTACTSFVCHMLEGILTEAKMALTNFSACESEIRKAEKTFTAGVGSWSERRQWDAVKYWASGLNMLGKAVNECGIAPQLSYIEQEANVLGLGNLTILEEAGTLLIHGSDFYQELYSAVEAVANHDFRSAGELAGKALSDLSKWTTGHLCTSPVCYVVNGIFQYLADLESDIGKCENDFKGAWHDFNDAFVEFTGYKNTFSNSTKNVSKGVNDLGLGVHAVADAVKDCHMAQFAAILEKLAVELGLVPEVGWIAWLIKILVNGVDIAYEVAAALEDFAAHNWPGFGYNVVKLVEKLLLQGGTKALSQLLSNVPPPTQILV